jgi:hypothetical protein
MSVYLATTVRQWLDQAQFLLEQHISRTGRCTACGEPEPCGTTVEAQKLMARYGRLPRRRPGLTRPDLCAPRPH